MYFFINYDSKLTQAQNLALNLAPNPVAYAGFSKGEEGGRKFVNNAHQKKNFSSQNQFVFLPKIR